MKKLVLISIFVLAALCSNAQTDSSNTGIDTTQFAGYKVCMTCGEQWSTSNQVNQYATGQSKSQQRTLNENSAAAQTINSSKRFVRGIAATVVGVFVAGVTMAIISKTNQTANAIFYH